MAKLVKVLTNVFVPSLGQDGILVAHSEGSQRNLFY